LPCVAATFLAVTAPPKTDTDVSATCAVVHPEPLALEERKRTIGAVVGYSEGPRLVAGVSSVRTCRPGTAIAAAPAPTQPAGRYEAESGE